MRLQLATVFGAVVFAGGPALASVVTCPGGLVDSSDAIEAALNDAAPGETVYLEPCTYYLTRAVEVRKDFQGALVGGGKDLTTIEILPGAKIDGVRIDAAGGMRFSTLFLFEIPEQGAVTLSDLSIVVTDPEPAGHQQLNRTWWYGSLYNLVVIDGPRVDTTIERVGFHGGPGGFFGVNVAHASHIFGGYDGTAVELMAGDHILTECDFSWTGVTYNPFLGRDATFTVTDNTFTDILYGPWLEACSGCTGLVARNHIVGVRGMGVALAQSYGAFLTEASSYVVEHNDIQGVATADGIWMEDTPYLHTLDAVVSSNQITMDATWGGIGGGGVDGIVVANNKISGTALAGIYFINSSGVSILGNEVNQLTAVPNNYARNWGLPVAPVTLWDTDHSIVVGGAARANAVEWSSGGDLENVFTGVDVQYYSGLGEDVSDAMEDKQAIRETMP